MSNQVKISSKKCAYCELKFDEERFQTRDHFIPSSKGGTGRPGNIYIVCQYCNSLKRDFLPFEFIYYLHCRIKLEENVIVGSFEYGVGLLKRVRRNIAAIYREKSYSGTADNTIIVTTRQRRRKPLPAPVEKVKTNGIHFVLFRGRECPCVGFIEKAFHSSGGNLAAYQNAYYDKEDDVYVFIKESELIAFYSANIRKFILPFFPEKKDARQDYYTRHAGDCVLSVNKNTGMVVSVVDKWMSEPEPSFHEQETA